MKISDLEIKLRAHAERAKENITSPFDIESEEFKMTNKHSIYKAVLTAAVVCLLGTTVFAAYRYMSARDVAESLGDSILEQQFDGDKPYETVTDGDYKATVLGITSGKNISSFGSYDEDIAPERTYAVVAVERRDGKDMTYDDNILISPLIDGLKPWEYNIYTMHGGYSARITNGILYRIIEFDSIEYFADRNVYMAVTDSLNNSSYSFDEETGRISANEDYEGTNMLIRLDLDGAKADPTKAEEYIKSIDNEIRNDNKDKDIDTADNAADDVRKDIVLEVADKNK